MVIKSWPRAAIALVALMLAPASLVGAAHADERDRKRGDRHDDRGGRDWNHGRDSDHGNNWNRGRDWGHHDNHGYDNHRRGSDLSLSFSFGRPFYGSAPYYGVPAYRAPVYRAPAYRAPAVYNSYGLRPNDCRDDRRWDYWRGRPAEIVVRLCANAYGEVYVVEGSQRLLGYRY
ncbi:MAG: hypothetical protein SGJ21_01730 [Alphaproteobacteria bacterium]|nr:hypothetical protein [Alphaproteobacteria bacterium]